MIKLTEFPKISLNNPELNQVVFTKSLIANKQSIIFPKDSAINFFSYKNILRKKKTGRLIELIFFGLNYNAKRIKHFRKPWVLDLQKSHKIKVNENRNSVIKTFVFKRRVLFFSFDRQRLTELVYLLKQNRKQNSYSGHGLIARNDVYKTKPGKIRQK